MLFPLQAAHIVGGEVTYRCLGFTNDDPSTNSRRYEFKIGLFRDCQGGGSDFDSPSFIIPMHISIYQGDDFFTTLFLDAPEREIVDPNPGNPCLIVPPNVCVEQGVYTFEIDLPIVDVSYHMAYQRCCRNNTITNIVEPQAAGATYTIELTPEAQASCNSSPSFEEYPPPVLCVDQPFVYDFSAVDVDGDLLVYEFCTPLLGGGNSGENQAPNGISPNPDQPPPYAGVIFIAPTYTAAFPLSAASGLELNANTGIMTGEPVNVGQFVVGVCVSEYRNGVLLSTVRRDFQFNVTNCENTVFADIQEDSVVINAGLDEYVISTCGDTQVSLVNESGQVAFINEYLWEFDVNGTMVTGNSRDFTYDFPGLGSYPGLMIVNPSSEVCSDTVQVRVNVFPSVESDFTFAYDTCVANPVDFSNLSIATNGQDIVSYNWLFNDGGISGEISPSYQYVDPGDYFVQLSVTDENGCADTHTEQVSYFPVPDLIVISPSAFAGCVPEDIFFDNLSFPIDETYTFNWDFGDGGTGDALSPTYLYEDPGLFTVSLEIISPLGCLTDTVFEELILMEPRPTAGFSLSPTELDNFMPEVKISDGSTGSYRWFYDLNGESTSLQPSPTYTLQDTGLAYITQVVTHPSGCVDSLTQFIDVVPKVTFFFPNAFTPNGDGKNDVFRAAGFTRGFQGFELMVWNRWGEPVFASEDPLRGWDGRKNNTGQDQPPGIYLYEAVLTGPRGELNNYRGFVTLIR